METSLIPVINSDHMQLAYLAEDKPFLPDEIILEIFSYLNLQELANCRLIARRFSKIDDLILKKILEHMTPFGKEEWETYFGEVGKAPPLPHLNVLKEVYKTYMLVLLPETVDGKPLTLKLFKTLAENPNGEGHVTKINISNTILAQYGDVANVTSRWMLFPKDLLDRTHDRGFWFQKEIVAEKGDDFEVARLFDAIVAIASRHVQSGKCLFSFWYMRCQETINIGYMDEQILVGGFGPGGLDVNDSERINPAFIGVAAMRK